MESSPQAAPTPASVPTQRNAPFTVFELRRYLIASGARQRFARRFETWFPDAFQQLGALAFGQFFEREQPDRFTWLRGYRDMPSRLEVNTTFYDGPLWQEHKAALNGDILDNDDVLLLRPLYPDSALTVLPAIDPVSEPRGAQGLVVAQILKVAPGRLAACALAAEQWFVHYHGRGVTEAGILATLDEPNNFPRHPVRSDGTYIVWLGVLRDDLALASLQPVFDAAAAALRDAGLLAGPAELVTLEPSPRSRLRWMPVVSAIAAPGLAASYAQVPSNAQVASNAQVPSSAQVASDAQAAA